MQSISKYRALKLVLPLLAAITMLAVTMLVLPVQAADPDDHDLYLKASAAGSPDIEVSSDGKFVALVYFKNKIDGGVYLKSGEVISGWRTRANPIGFVDQTAPKLAFSPTSTTKVYAVWLDGLANDTSIRYAVCDLAQGAEPTCPTIDDLYNSTDTLSSLDLAVDATGTGGLHLAWKNVETGAIETLYLPFPLSGLPLPVTIPTAVLTPAAVENYRKPVLAAANSIYLALLNDDDNDTVIDPRKVQIYRSALGGHTWNSSKTYDIASSSIWSGFTKWDNPAVAANGNNVSVVWDGYYDSSTGNLFSLVEGTTFNDGAVWTNTRYITSTQTGNTTPAGSGDERASRPFPVLPFQEEGLRPSLAISGGGFAVAWQQRPVDQNLCRAGGGGEGQENEVNGSSEIFLYRGNITTSWTMVKHATPGDYSTYAVAPDIAIGPAGDTHLVYMKAISIGQNCSDGTAATDYGIYYQGPPGFMGICPGGGCWGYDPGDGSGNPPDNTGDGDDAEVGGPYLPIVFKNF